MSKIGGTTELFHTYNYNRFCDHYGVKGYSCIKDEYCEKGLLIPTDINTIEAGFNFYQVLMILSKTHPDHDALSQFKRDENEYLYLLQKEDEFIANIEYQNQVTAYNEKKNFATFNKIGVQTMDKTIIKIFPDSFISFTEKTASEQKDKKISRSLMQQVNNAKKTKNPIDRQQILEKLRKEVREKVLVEDANKPKKAEV